MSKGALQKIKMAAPAAIIKRHRLIFGVGIISVLLIAGGIGLSLQQASQARTEKAAALMHLAKEQKAKAAELARKQVPEDVHADTSDLHFKDVSDSAFKRPTCGRLENRPGIVVQGANCNYNIRAHGELTMAVVFAYENTTSGYAALANTDANNKQSLAYVNTYLKEQAARYKVADPPSVSMTLFGPYKVSSPVVEIYYRDNAYKILEIFNKTSLENKVPEEKYDMVHFVLLEPIYGGMAFPGMHRAFTYQAGYTGVGVPTFIHETLHLFGASDKYNNNDCDSRGTNDPFGRYNGALPGYDIMCSNISVEASKINDITAREIGWAN